LHPPRSSYDIISLSLSLSLFQEERQRRGKKDRKIREMIGENKGEQTKDE
jgi:hypothetical protein